jgi:homoserine kinase
MQESFRAHNVEARPLHLRLDTKGARVLHRKESSVKKK